MSPLRSPVPPGSCLGVLGAGSWGTALAVHFGAAGHRVRLWARDGELAGRMAAERANPEYLPGVTIPPTVEPTSEMAELVGCDLVLLVVPSHGFRQLLRQFLALHPVEAPGGRPLRLVSATKGIESETLARMSQVTSEEAAAAGRQVHFAVLSGPSFAAELAGGTPTAAVIASEQPDLAAAIRETLATSTFRLYSSHDVVGG